MPLPGWAFRIALGLAAVFVLAAIWLAVSPVWGSDRHLSSAKRNEFAKALRVAGWNAANIALRYKPECDECRKYAVDLAGALAMAGWSDKAEVTKDQNDALTGIHIVVENLNDRPPDADLLAEALIQANIRFQFSTSELHLVPPTILFVYQTSPDR
jgi:hypothetical protein